MIGQKFNKLLVIAAAGKNKHGKLQWKCLCDCGKTTITLGVYLRNGDTNSCGCYGKEQRSKSVFKHGLSHKNNPEYEIWKGMKARCYNKNHIAYPNYGGRGVKVCLKWKGSFLKFIKDVGKRPSPKYSLDRYPNTNGNYESCNFRWATPEQQSRNKRNNRYYTFGTKTLIMEDWAKIFKVDQSTLWEHLETKSFATVYEFYSKKHPEIAAEIEQKLQSILNS